MKLISDLTIKGVLACTLLASGTSVAQTFQEVSVAAGIDHYAAGNNPVMFMNGGVAWFDFNGDGWEDIYLPGGALADLLLVNDQDGTFTDLSISSGISALTTGHFTIGCSAADFDQNGYVDVLVTTDHSGPNLLLMNNGDGTFSENSANAGLTDVAFSVGASLGDYDQDGWVDIYITNWRNFEARDPTGEGYPDRLYHNNGNGTFTDVTDSQGLLSTEGCGLVGSFTDFDLDGDVDLLVGNDFGFELWAEENEIFQNNSGNFSDVSDSWLFNVGMSSMGIAGADYDEDGDLDYYITDKGANVLMRNDGSQFSDQAAFAGVESEWNLIGQTGFESWSWGTAFFDYDHDSDVDLFSTNGFIATVFPDENRLFSNGGSGQFTDVSIAAGVADPNIGRGCAVADYDHDGDLDILVVNCDTLGGSSRSQLLRNDVGNAQKWLKLNLQGTISNPEALGSTVRVFVDGRMLLRQMDGGGASYGSHHSKVIHFGLDSYETIDSVVVTWPSGLSENFGAQSTDQTLTLIEGNTLVSDAGINWAASVVAYPNPAQDHLTLRLIQPSTVRIKLLNYLGSVCFKWEGAGKSTRHHVKIPDHIRGVHSLIIEDGTGNQTVKKVLIQ